MSDKQAEWMGRMGSFMLIFAAGGLSHDASIPLWLRCAIGGLAFAAANASFRMHAKERA